MTKMTQVWRHPAFALSVLLAGMLLLAFLLTGLSTPRQGEPFVNRSVFNSGPSGYRAWFLANQKAGLPLVVWQHPFQQLGQLPKPAVMLIVSPFTVGRSHVTFGQAEVDSLLKWVKAGNTLVLLDDFQRYGSATLLDRLHLKVVDPAPDAHRQPQAFSALQLSASDKLIGSYVRQPIKTHNRLAFVFPQTMRSQPAVLLKDAKRRPVLIKMAYGQGALILGTPAELGGNAYLHDKTHDNYQFLSNLLVLEKKPIFINEFVHGHNELTNVFAYYREKTPLGGMFTQLLLGFLFVLWLSFVRWRPRPEPAANQQSAGHANSIQVFVESLAGVYYRTRSGSQVLAPQLKQIEQTLHKRYQLQLDEETRVRHLLADLPSQYSEKGRYNNQDGMAVALSAEAMADTLKKAREIVTQETRIPHPELLKLSRQLALIQELLQYGSHRKR